MSSQTITVCDTCYERIRSGDEVTSVLVRSYEHLVHNSNKKNITIDVCGKCASTKTFKLDALKGVVPT